MKRSLCVTVAALLVLSPATVAQAAKFWKNSVGSGSWNTGRNWSAASAAGADNGGAPVFGEAVNIVHTDGTARTITYNVNAPTIGLMSINLTGAGVAANTLSLPTNNNLTASAIFVGGHSGVAPNNGRGAISQSAGTVSTGVGGDWVLGHGVGSMGTYTLTGGAVVASQSEFIGASGTGVFNHSGGRNTINASGVGALRVGANAGATGTYNLSGTGDLFSFMPELIGINGSGFFNQSGGSNITSNDLTLGDGASGIGSYTISGGHLSLDDIIVGNAGVGTMTIQGTAVVFADNISINGASNLHLNGGTLRLNSLSIGSSSRISYTAGKIRLDGDRNLFSDVLASSLIRFDVSAGKHLDIGGIATFDGGSSAAIYDVKNGGILSSLQGRIGLSSNSQGVVNVSGPGSTWVINGLLTVGGMGVNGVLNIRDGGLVTESLFGVELVINNNGVVNLDGGAIRIGEYTRFGNGVFNFNSGTLRLSSDRAIGSDPSINAILGGAPKLTSGKTLAIEGTATLLTTVTLDGGALTAPALVNGHYLNLQRGTLNVTNQAVTIGAGGLLGATLDLNDDMTVNVTLGVANQGLVTGDGQIGGTFANAAAGELRAEPGKSLKLTGINNVNAGRINLLGGELEFTQNLTNSVGALISGNGTLITRTGMTNQGTMNFAGTSNILGDVTNAAGGKIIAGGGGAAIFFDDVANNGEIRTSANGFTVFFGSVTGSGAFTGTGTVNFEGDLSPGSSPALATFGGDVSFGADATLHIEIGGAVAGSQYDQVNVADKLSLGGALELSLINGYSPSVGQSFNILDWNTLSGTFTTINLPALVGLGWNTSQLYTTGVLSVVAPGSQPADFDEDGDVDGVDLARWRTGFGAGATHAQGDADGDLDVDGADFLAWQRQFGGAGATSSSSTTASSAVPEPATWGLLLLTMIATAARPGWRRRSPRGNP